ncbi:MAG: TIGR02206 family membrane protein, partial [Saprospiraceae bacterium]
SWRDYRNAIIFLFGYFFIFLMSINYLIGSNYGYTMSKPPNGSLLDFFGPWPLYIIVATCIAFPFFFLLYFPFFWKDRRARKLS